MKTLRSVELLTAASVGSFAHLSLSAFSSDDVFPPIDSLMICVAYILPVRRSTSCDDVVPPYVLPRSLPRADQLKMVTAAASRTGLGGVKSIVSSPVMQARFTAAGVCRAFSTRPARGFRLSDHVQLCVTFDGIVVRAPGSGLCGQHYRSEAFKRTDLKLDKIINIMKTSASAAAGKVDPKWAALNTKQRVVFVVTKCFSYYKFGRVVYPAAAGAVAFFGMGLNAGEVWNYLQIRQREKSIEIKEAVAKDRLDRADAERAKADPKFKAELEAKANAETEAKATAEAETKAKTLESITSTKTEAVDSIRKTTAEAVDSIKKTTAEAVDSIKKITSEAHESISKGKAEAEASKGKAEAEASKGKAEAEASKGKWRLPWW